MLRRSETNQTVAREYSAQSASYSASMLDIAFIGCHIYMQYVTVCWSRILFNPLPSKPVGPKDYSLFSYIVPDYGTAPYPLRLQCSVPTFNTYLASDGLFYFSTQDLSLKDASLCPPIWKWWTRRVPPLLPHELAKFAAKLLVEPFRILNYD